MSFRFGGKILADYNGILHTSAEIPPVGAPSGFDSAAFSIVLFVLTERCRSAQDDTEGMSFCEI